MKRARLSIVNALTRFVGRADHWATFDECYGAIAHAPDTHHMVVSVVPQARGRTLIVGSLSRSLTLTGMRIGYLAGPKAVIIGVGAPQSQTTFKPNVIEQHALPHLSPLKELAMAVNICFWLIAVAHLVFKRLRTDRLSLLHRPVRLVEGRNGAGECGGPKTDQHIGRTAILRRSACHRHKREIGPG